MGKKIPEAQKLGGPPVNSVSDFGVSEFWSIFILGGYLYFRYLKLSNVHQES